MQQERLRILVVDDEQDVREITCRIVKRLRHEAVAAENGQRAIELLQTERFDLAVVDTHMPGVDGNEVRRFIKENLPELGVITASGMSLDHVKTDCIPPRHVYLKKPYQVAELIDAIAKLTQEKQPA
ncbi:MAG: response regulator [Planctomycetota bacterium]